MSVCAAKLAAARRFSDSEYRSTVTGKGEGLYINGEFVDPVEGGTIEWVVAAGTKLDIDIAAKAAKKAYKTSWGLKVPGAQRGKLMSKLAVLMEEHTAEFAALDALAYGKAYNTACGRDNEGAIVVMEYYAGWADKINGKTIEVHCFSLSHQSNSSMFRLVFSLSLKIAPALATGNTIVLKPSELTPLSALLFCTLIEEAGFPSGVINITNEYGPTAGQAISEHPLIEKVAFTGSSLTGRKIMEATAKSNLKPVTLELGGKSPNVIFDDADLEQAVKWAIHEGIYDKFLDQFTELARAIKVGDPFSPDTYQGPQNDGATVHLGGRQIGQEGYFIEPTIFTQCQPDMKIVREEIFGPVACVMKFTTEDEVVEQANDTSYGLAASVFIKDIDRAIRVAHALEAGTAWINCANQTEISMPFGGFKQSGIDRELSEYALEK
ncbi:Aldehyde/histidinol dehydrogenase [Suillus lakei]|nr:Aldehyde/histidinol dehydrogenase [Suillus lakei]